MGGGVLRAREEDENEARSRMGLKDRGKEAKGLATVVGLANKRDDLALYVSGVVLWRQERGMYQSDVET